MHLLEALGGLEVGVHFLAMKVFHILVGWECTCLPSRQYRHVTVHYSVDLHRDVANKTVSGYWQLGCGIGTHCSMGGPWTSHL